MSRVRFDIFNSFNFSQAAAELLVRLESDEEKKTRIWDSSSFFSLFFYSRFILRSVPRSVRHMEKARTRRSKNSIHLESFSRCFFFVLLFSPGHMNAKVIPSAILMTLPPPLFFKGFCYIYSKS